MLIQSGAIIPDDAAVAAATGRDEKMVYRGLLETGRENLATGAVSWVPIVGWALPDETQRMRIGTNTTINSVVHGEKDIPVHIHVGP